MELIPAIDLLGGRVVRLARGRYDNVTVYSSDPVAIAQRWIDEGAARIHIVDLDGAREGRPAQFELVKAIVAAASVPCQVAGGIRDAPAARRAVDTGADRVVLGSALIREPRLGEELVAMLGRERIVAAVDVRGGEALGDGWVSASRGIPALDHVRALADAGIDWFAVTAIARDGVLEGPDLGLLESVAAAVPGSRLIASAGIATVADVEALASAGYAGAILGRALYEGTLRLQDALAAARGIPAGRPSSAS
jgi:phosphoribosylformimino-5-aminoimidazole carboxamide ribotide isomerase